MVKVLNYKLLLMILNLLIMSFIKNDYMYDLIVNASIIVGDV